MRRLLVVVLLLYSCTLAAQTDPRRVRTVQIDDGPVSAAPPDDAPARAARQVESPLGTEQAEEGRDGAEHPDEHMVLARQLVNLGPDSGSQSEIAAACVPDPATMRKEIAATYRASPGEFHGISPQSVYWPQVEQAWHDYYAVRCGVQGDESPAGIISYAANLSTEQLRAVLAFQESSAGSAFIEATRRARQEIETGPAPRPPPDREEASAAFRQAMLRLKVKYEDAPK